MKPIFKHFLLLFLIVGISITTAAQQITVKGIVEDESGEPLIGANILEKGTANGTSTDFDGNFTISVGKDAMLVISYIGYVTQTLPAASEMKVVMREDTQMLDEVVVIGYGSVKKTDLTGSVVAINAEEMNRGAITSPQELLQGKVPGLLVQSGDGAPGSGSTMRIRGGASLKASNNPLIVIDGVPVADDAAPGTPNALATINPNDIETFTILKDASATAIYGSRASNGVIIITTKKGGSGKIKVSYSGTFSVKDPSQRLKTMNAAQLKDVIAGQYPAGTSTGDYFAELLNRYPDQDTDWQDEIFRTGLSTDHNLSVSGKAGLLPFRLSLGYTNEKGTLLTSKYERYTAAVNLSPTFLNNHLSVNLNVKGTINKNRFADSGAVGTAVFFDPTKPVYSDDMHGYNGYWNWVTTGDGITYTPNTQAAVNPVSLLNDRNNAGTTKRSVGNIQIDYKIHGFEDLRLNLNLGYDVSKATGDNFVRPGSIMSARDGNFALVGSGKNWDNLRRNQLLEFYANYARDFSAIRSSLSVMAGYSWQHFYAKDFSQSMSNVMDESPRTINGWTYNPDTRRYYLDGEYAKPYENYLVSFFGRLNYSFMDKYLLTATLRRDGSSRFSNSNRWGMFPSVALAWNLLNENFMEETRSLMSSLKLRLGYGVTGQQEIGDYMYIANYLFSSNPNSSYLGNGLLKPQGYSPDLRWEQTSTYNVAVDFGFFNNRLTGSIEYYQKHTKDLLNEVSAPAGTNFTNIITANVGKMKNEGIELNLTGRVISSRDINWTLGYNLTWNKSRISRLTVQYNPEYPGIPAGSYNDGGANYSVLVHQVGSAPSTFWLYQQVYDKDGRPIQNAVVDRNNDGQITDKDRYMTGKSSMPDVFMGLSSEFTYKNWDLGFNLRASIGNYVYNGVAASNSTVGNMNSTLGFMWNLAQSSTKTGFADINSTPQLVSDYFLENASFLKMDNITLGYSFDKLFTERLSGRISLSMQNVFTITDYSGIDPECGAIDSGMWPRAKTYTLGLSLNF